MSAGLEARSRVANPGPLFIAALGVLMCFGPMAIDMYLPALPAIGLAFDVGQDKVQWSLSAFFLGFGVGQIVWGALADRLGRRRPVAAGILLYGIGCIGCSLTNDIGHLAIWRFVQALGACAGPVLARAMVRDVFGRDRAASVLSLMMLVMGVAPMVAPILGGHILLVGTWRTIFWVQACFVVVAFAGLISLPETLPADRRQASRLSGMIRSYGRLLTDRRYLGYALCSSFIYGGMFAYVSGTPFVYIELFGVRPENYGYLFGVNIVGMIIVNTINSRVVLKFGTDRVLRMGCLLAAAVGLALLGFAVTGVGGLVAIASLLFLFMGLTGMIAANAMAGGMSIIPEIAGSASALSGALQFTFGAIAGSAVGSLANGTAVPLAGVICTCGIASAIFNLALVRRFY
ncbi:MAG TPA: Bcr/CflA family multidrug efflux MFS transporter [Aliidongia sp.]|uniref:Bcr/CflA family multidrug efflux MFS transporter n=1 Tax=Aliidongia sp. TaxID=1914230 RepID=UPI002DDD78E5|nr:Bcr/CflA family multidrug efflux MFS transporter [Aliidongia sp.]HEV2677773.1 Bcr/CflA family multidrug efflux MFS transporter [Aliidongia sp.]